MHMNSQWSDLRHLQSSILVLGKWSVLKQNEVDEMYLKTTLKKDCSYFFSFSILAIAYMVLFKIVLQKRKKMYYSLRLHYMDALSQWNTNIIFLNIYKDNKDGTFIMRNSYFDMFSSYIKNSRGLLFHCFPAK